MRFQAGHAAVHAEGFGQSTKFSISASAKAFRGLIDGLYSRKIEAAIRELSTNAFDAHKAAGTIQPFDIHLPTPLKPSFWLRDYGTGMSHDFMMTRFAIMFESTKDGLNPDDASLITPDDQVGCLGLGRMSFFTYTDTCTITVWQDGEARYYTVFIGPTGEPEVAHAGSAPSDEPTGVRVEFAVKNRDMKSFENAAIRVFKGFPVMPKGLPIDVRDAISQTPLEMGAFWKAFPKAYLPDGGFYARQGCVLYPIDLFQIDDRLIVTDSHDGDEEDATVELSENYARFMGLDMTIVMDFPIGSIDFDLSRERLQYNDRTVDAIRERWNEFTADLDAVIEKEFSGKASGFDRFATARSPLFESLGPLFQQSSFFLEAGAIEEYIYNLLPSIRSKFDGSTHAFQRAIEYRDLTDEKGNDHRSTVYTFSGRNAHEAPKKEDMAQAIFVYRDDNGRFLNGRVHYHLQQVGKRYAMVFEPGCLSWKVYNQMGRPPIIRATELIQPPKEIAEKIARRAGGGGGTFDRIKIIDGHDWRAAREDDDTDGSLFALINRGEIIAPNKGPYPLFWEYPEMSNNDVTAISGLLVATGEAPIALINTRSNDRAGRWDDLPLFYSVLDKFAERLSKEQIGQCVMWINDSRFRNTEYHKAIVILKGRSHKGMPRNAITDLGRRYYDKPSKMDGALIAHFSHLYSSNNPVLQKIVNDIIHIATGMGMDVLPEPDSLSPLLSKKWEFAVKNINSTNRYDSHHSAAQVVFRQMLIEHASS